MIGKVMMLKIETYHGTYNRSKRARLADIKYIVVHYTGGTGSAKNNAIYFAGGNRKASADYFVDKDGTIVEYNNPAEGYYTWHCGDGGGRYGISNANSIGVEVVSAGEAFTKAQIAAVKNLIMYLRNIYTGIQVAPVRHYDASRKSCPAPYIAEAKWSALKSELMGVIPPNTITVEKPKDDAQMKLDPKPAATQQANTKAAWVRNLQSECNRQGFSNQKVDGIVGPATLAGCPTIKRGSKGAITALLQRRLETLGFSCGGADGVFGGMTQNAVVTFQRKYGLAADGVVGRNSWNKLLNL